MKASPAVLILYKYVLSSISTYYVNYQEVFNILKKVTVEFSRVYNNMVLTKDNEWLIYLSSDLYNLKLLRSM